MKPTFFARAVWASVACSLLACGLLPCARGQEVLLEYDFEDESLEDFFNPTGLQAIDLCGEIGPGGEATADEGGVLLTNDAFFGVTILALRPERAAEAMADRSDYAARVRVVLETVNELSFVVRGRMGIRDGLNQVDASLERGYSVSLFPSGADPRYPDGALAIGELTGCHEIVEHPEWPGGKEDGYAVVEPGVPIVPDESYWLEATVQGDDETGPVLIAARVWLDGDDPPAGHQLIVVDPDGLDHNAATLDPATACQIVFGTSLDLGQQPGATARIDDLSVTAIGSCETPPVVATRRLWDDRVHVQGTPAAIYADGQEYDVTFALSDIRPAGACPAPTGARIVETLPIGWELVSASNGGVEEGGAVVWDMADLGAVDALGYRVRATGSGLVRFIGELIEAGGNRIFPIAGEERSASEKEIAPIGDFGSIQHWLILGPFQRQVAGSAPGEAQIRRDYLTDGTVTEKTVEPIAGDTIEPAYGGQAASTALAPDPFGRNPGGVPTWVEWRDLDDADDRIDFEDVYGAQDDVMVHALTYLEALEDVTVNLGVSSDDSVQILLDGTEIHIRNEGRSALTRMYQDTPFTHPKLGNIALAKGIHVLVVKVFEGGGQHNFRVGFLDGIGIEIPGGPEEIAISLAPPPVVTDPIFLRGDGNSDGKVDLSDAVFVLNYLFLGGTAPGCLDTADADDNESVEITDPILVLNFLFLGGPSPAPPGTASCGPDPTPDDPLAECVYDPSNCP